ncbi:unnamed protein product [Periconia digitata]|uniref:Uncharacterized protein n=1 Tax=Periconia digitata TaxID=1303443 RepID=A0A9W4UFJ4_9PLEO|nr:unnamed protein product [Periconia digitata]
MPPRERVSLSMVNECRRFYLSYEVAANTWLHFLLLAFNCSVARPWFKSIHVGSAGVCLGRHTSKINFHLLVLC